MGKKGKVATNSDDKPDKVVKAATPLPALQVFCICNVQMAEAMNVDLLFPFLAFMIEDMGYTGEALGYHAGILAASFCGAQFCTSVAWGMISDRYGRKFAIVAGTLGAGLGMLIFGFAKTFQQAVLGRIVGGLLCGNLGVVKSFLTEITDDTNRSSAFYLFSLSWAVGSVFAPLIGGMLCKPAEKFPAVFSDSPKSIFVEYPYLFPCLITVSVNVIASLLCMMFMIETVGAKKNDAQNSGPSMSDDITVVTDDSNSLLEEGIELPPLPRSSGSSGYARLSVAGDNEDSGFDEGRAGVLKSAQVNPMLSLSNPEAKYDSILEFESAGYDSPVGAVHDVPKLQFALGQHSPVQGASSALSSPGRHMRLRSHSSTAAPHNSGAWSSVITTGTNSSGSAGVSGAYSIAEGGGVGGIAAQGNYPSDASLGGDLEQNLAGGSSSIYRDSGPDALSMGERNGEADQHSNGVHNDSDNSDAEGEGPGEEEDSSDPADEEVCCPALFDNLSYLTAWLSCATKTRSLDTGSSGGHRSGGGGGTGGGGGGMDNSTHGLLEQGESSKQLIGTFTADEHSSDAKQRDTPLNTSTVLTQRVVVLATLNYGMICASSILMDETLPLFLKLGTDQGGFGFSSAEIGTLLSIGAGGMMVLTMLTMPLTNGVSNKWISKFSLALSIPLELAFPLIALLNNEVFAHIHNNTERLWLLWPVLIIVNTVKNLFTCLAFTSSIIMVNHSVTDEYLGAVNGLGQSLGALARSLGPAVGGLLWSVGTRYNFVYFNFIATTLLYLLNYYVSHLVPKSLDHRKKPKVAKRT